MLRRRREVYEPSKLPSAFEPNLTLRQRPSTRPTRLRGTDMRRTHFRLWSGKPTRRIALRWALFEHGPSDKSGSIEHSSNRSSRDRISPILSRNTKARGPARGEPFRDRYPARRPIVNPPSGDASPWAIRGCFGTAQHALIEGHFRQPGPRARDSKTGGRLPSRVRRLQTSRRAAVQPFLHQY